jgi:hypothetical protein
MLQQLPITRSRQLDIRPGGLPGPLLESVQHVVAFKKPGDIGDAVFHLGVDSHLLDAGSNAGHRLPVIWLQPLLYAKQLKAGNPHGSLWKASDVAA